jgi:hypothetical protein
VRFESLWGDQALTGDITDQEECASACWTSEAAAETKQQVASNFLAKVELARNALGVIAEYHLV